MGRSGYHFIVHLWLRNFLYFLVIPKSNNNHFKCLEQRFYWGLELTVASVMSFTDLYTCPGAIPCGMYALHISRNALTNEAREAASCFGGRKEALNTHQGNIYCEKCLLNDQMWKGKFKVTLKQNCISNFRFEPCYQKFVLVRGMKPVWFVFPENAQWTEIHPPPMMWNSTIPS